MDLKQIVNDKMEAVVESRKIEELIENKVAEAVDKAIEEYFNSWGEFQKDLDKTIKEKMKVNLKELDIPEYNKLIVDYIEKEMDRSMIEIGLEKVKENIKEILSSAPKEIKLQEIVDKYKKEEENDINDTMVENIYFDYKYSDVIDTFLWIKINVTKPDKYDRPDLKFTLSKIDNGKYELDNITLNGMNYDKDFTTVSHIYGMEKYMFKLWTAGTIILVDEDDFDDINTYTEYAM